MIKKMIQKNKKYFIMYSIAGLLICVFSFFFKADKNAKIEDETLDFEQQKEKDI